MALSVSIKEINLDYKIERGPSILKKLRTKARLIFQVLKVSFTKALECPLDRNLLVANTHSDNFL